MASSSCLRRQQIGPAAKAATAAGQQTRPNCPEMFGLRNLGLLAFHSMCLDLAQAWHLTG